LADKLESIIEGCKRGDKKSQERLYRRLSGQLFAICLRYADNYEEARDYLQEGFINVFNSIKQYEGKGSFEGWMKKIIINTVLQGIRKKRFMIPLVHDYQDNYEFHLPHMPTDLSESDLLGMIQELPRNYRIVFNLYAIEGYKHNEISQMLNITENTSKSHLFRARTKLQEKVNHHYSKVKRVYKSSVF